MKEERKYWFISEFYYPNETATGYILTQIINTFAQHQKANVISVGKTIPEQSTNITTYRAKPVANLNKNNLLQRLVKQFLLSIRLVNLFVRKVNKDDVVVVVTNPAILLLFISLLKSIKRVRLVIIVHDVFPENLIVAKIAKEKSFIYKTTRFLFDKAYKRGDLLITLGRDMQRRIQEKVKFPERVVVIPNFANTSIVIPVDKTLNPIVNELKITDKFIVLFTGNMGRMQGLENIMQTVELLKADETIHFLFIGDGVYYTKLMDFQKEKRIPNMTLLKTFPRKQENEFLNAGDVGLVTLLPNMMGTGVPSKTYSYMAAGKPILGVLDADSEVGLLISESNNGWIANPNNPKELSELIKSISKDKISLKEKGEKSRELAETSYSLKNITELYYSKITNL